MERTPPTLIEDVDSNTPGTDAYDAVPRDGPAIFISYPDSLTGSDPLLGRWVDLRLGAAALTPELAHPSEDFDWAIIDQLDCGPTMLPEQPTTAELQNLIRWAAERGGTQ